MLLNKKGVIEDFVFWIIRIILVIVVVSGLVAIVDYTLKTNLDTHNLGYKILVDRSISCFSVYDYDLYREQTGIIDSLKLNKDTIQKCIVSESEMQGIGIKFQPEGMKEFYYNQSFYEDYEPIAWSKTYTKISEKRYILLQEGENLKPSYIQIDAVVRII